MENSLNLKEQELIHGLKKGSQKDFDEIYRLYSKRLFAYCLRFTKSEENAEEIVQDVFVRLWVNRETIRQEETLRSLLFIMAKHRLINAYRSMVNSPVYEDYLDYQERLADGQSARSLEYKEFAEGLKKVIGRLPATQRKVIGLSRIQGKTNKEIAEELSLSEQTVKNQLSLALKTLRQDLEKLLVWIWTLLLVN